MSHARLTYTDGQWSELSVDGQDLRPYGPALAVTASADNLHHPLVQIGAAQCELEAADLDLSCPPAVVSLTGPAVPLETLLDVVRAIPGAAWQRAFVSSPGTHEFPSAAFADMVCEYLTDAVS